jgi:hypothetical protein
VYKIPCDNHNVDIRDLSANQRARAEATVKKWARVTVTNTGFITGLDRRDGLNWLWHNKSVPAMEKR